MEYEMIAHKSSSYSNVKMPFEYKDGFRAKFDVFLYWLRCYCNVSDNKSDMVNINSMKMHSHTFFEIIVIEEGSMGYITQRSNNEQFVRAGEYIIFSPGYSHKLVKYSVNLKYYSMAFDYFDNQIDIDLMNRYSCLVRPYSSYILKSFEYVFEYSENGMPNREHMLYAQIQNLFWLFFDNIRDEAENVFEDNFDKESDFARDRAFVNSVKEYILKNLSRNVTIDEFARSLYVSSRHLNRMLLRASGKTYRQLRDNIKCQIAKEMLESGVSIKETSESLGMIEANFSRFFKRVAGYSPSQYIEKSKKV